MPLLVTTWPIIRITLSGSGRASGSTCQFSESRPNLRGGDFMAEQTQNGSCHCGAVRYSVDIDLSKGTLRCNCSLCRKTRAWFAFAPAGNFRLDTGRDNLTSYRWTPEGKEQPNLTYHSCATCGVRTHAEGQGPGGA